MATITRTLDTLNAVTRDHLIPSLVNQVIYSNYLAKRLLGKSKPTSGGEKIKQPLEYGEEDIAWLAEYDAVTYAPKEIATSAFYDWKWLNGTIALSEMDMKIKNAGKEALLDLVEVKSKNLSRRFKRGFGQLLFKDSASSANEPATLYDIITATTGTVGGIDASVTANAWWKSKKLAIGGGVSYANLTDSGNDNYIENVVRFMYGKLTNDVEHPTMIVTTQDIFDTYERMLHTQNRYEDKRKVDGGFELLSFRGANMVVDTHVPAGQMYFLNENYLHFRHHPDSNFKFTPFRRATTGQHVFVAELDWHGAFTCSNRAYQGVVTGIPTNALSLA